MGAVPNETRIVASVACAYRDSRDPSFTPLAVCRAYDPLIDRSRLYARPQVVPDGGRTSEGNCLADPPNRSFTRSRNFWNVT